MVPPFQHQGRRVSSGVVRDALSATDIQTFFGPIHFDATGKNPAKTMIMLQVVKGEYKIVELRPGTYGNARTRR